MPEHGPNVLVILADDIGWFDVSAYHEGMIGPGNEYAAERGES